MPSSNPLKKKLRSGVTVVGTWMVIPSPAVAEVTAHAGFDFFIIDMEHGPATFETAEEMVRAGERGGASPLIRVPSGDSSTILRALETGAHGVLIPHIASAESAGAAVQAVKYHPHGTRGLSPYTRAANYGLEAPHLLTARKNAESFVGVIVEGLEGLHHFGDILATPHLDLVYFGLYDMSQALGIPGQTNDPRVRDALKAFARKARERGIAAGTLAQSQRDFEEFVEMGINVIAYKADCAILGEACSSIRSMIAKQQSGSVCRSAS